MKNMPKKILAARARRRRRQRHAEGSEGTVASANSALKRRVAEGQDYGGAGAYE
jgi:hypothetical protein